MAKKQDGRNEEVEALLDAIDVDPEKIRRQISGEGAGTPADIKTEPVKTEPAKTESAKTEPIKTEVPNPETIRADMLREMWGDQFKTVEDFKKANIPASLQELTNLRQKNQELETQVRAKPKHHYANDDIAKFDEFVRGTGIKDQGIFNKLNSSDVTNMNAMDALILERSIEDPDFASKEPQVQKRYFERKFNVDSKKVESGDLTQEELDDNMIEVSAEGRKAKVKLQGFKDKIKMPEAPADLPPAEKVKWTPEIEKVQKEGWTKVNEAIVKEYEKIPIPIEGSAEPVINFVLPEEMRKSLSDKYLNYAVSNQMEVDKKENVNGTAAQMYYEVIVSNLGKIVKAVSERVRSMTEEEYMKAYSNPSPKNTDKPDLKEGPLSDEEKSEKAFQAELNR